MTTDGDAPLQIKDSSAVLDELRARLLRVPVIRDFTADDNPIEALAAGMTAAVDLAVAALDSAVDVVMILAVMQERFALIETVLFGAPIPLLAVDDPDDTADTVRPAQVPAAKRPDDDPPPMEPNPYMGGG